MMAFCPHFLFWYGTILGHWMIQLHNLHVEKPATVSTIPHPVTGQHALAVSLSSPDLHVLKLMTRQS